MPAAGCAPLGADLEVE
jgi:hypothetical protein